MSTAITMFLSQVSLSRSIPFPVCLPKVSEGLNNEQQVTITEHILQGQSSWEADEDGEETVTEPEFSDNYYFLCECLKEGIDFYISKNPDNKELHRSLLEILQDVDNFGRGEDIYDCQLGLSIVQEYEIRYIDIEFESNMIEITWGGSVYGPKVGGDSYTNCRYQVWSDGDEGYNDFQIFDFEGIVDFFMNEGVKVTIEREDFSFDSSPDDDSNV